MTSVFSTYFRHNVDATFGNSGSGIIRNGEILGIATHCPCNNYAARVSHSGFAAARDQLCPSPPPCPWDLNGNNVVDNGDVVLLLAAWGPNAGHPADFNDDGFVNYGDIVVLLGNWGPCP